MTAILLKTFRQQGRRVCVLERLDQTSGNGTDLDREAKECEYRVDGVEFTDSHCANIIFGECAHPERSKRLTLFCPPMIHRLEKESE